MNIVDDLMPSRARARAAKAPEKELTPLEKALAVPLPPEIGQAVEDLRAAIKLADDLKEVYLKAQAAASQTPERQLRDAERAAERAHENVGYSKDELRDARRELRDAESALQEAQRGFFRNGSDITAAKQAVKAAETMVAKCEQRLGLDEQREKAARETLAAISIDPVASTHEALVKAETRREVAIQIGGDAPSESEIADLRAAFERAKSDDQATRKLKAEVLKEAYQRRAAGVREACHKLVILLDPHRERLSAAADVQLSTAATLIAQTELLKNWYEGWGVHHSPFTCDALNGGRIEGDPTLEDGHEILDAYVALREGVTKGNVSL